MVEDLRREKGPYGNEIAEAIYRGRTTIAALARRTGIERPHLSQVVNGWRLPSAEQLDALSAALGWSARRLYPTAEYREAIEATRKSVVA